MDRLSRRCGCRGFTACSTALVEIPLASRSRSKEAFNYLNNHTHAPERVGLAGNDVSEPEDYVPPLVHEFNGKSTSPFTIRYSIPTDFAEVVAKRKDTPTLTGDFNPIFQGTYSSRIELKQTTRELEQKLLNAEKLGALSNWLGKPTDDQMLWRAWEPVLFNQTHDLASGVMADHVYKDTVQSYAFSGRLADEMTTSRFATVTSRIDTRGEGTPVVIFNPLGATRRNDAVEVDLGFRESENANSIVVKDPQGNEVPNQITYAERYGDGTLRRVKVAFNVTDVPGLGYATYRITGHAATTPDKEIAPSSSDVNSIENVYYKVTFNTKSGEILSIIDQAKGGKELLSGPANVVAREDDKGDLWELYHTLDGTSYKPATIKFPVPNSSIALLSSGSSDKPGTIIQGPVFSEFKVSHPLGSGTFSTRVRLNKGSRRLDIETELVNNEKQVRYQVLFPTAIQNGHNVQEIPFGSVERPVGVEYPAQNWVDYGSDQEGISLINHGMPGNVVSDNGTMMLSLLRSQSLGDYNEGHTSASGYELDTPRTFHYALFSHSGDWRTSGVYHEAQEFNCPLLVVKAEKHPGDLPNKWGVVDIDQPNVVLTAMKPGADKTTIIRVYEASGKASSHVRIKLNARVLSANEANLMEDTGAKLSVEHDAVFIDLHPFEIKTLKLRLAPRPGSRDGH